MLAMEREGEHLLKVHYRMLPRRGRTPGVKQVHTDTQSCAEVCNTGRAGYQQYTRMRF